MLLMVMVEVRLVTGPPPPKKTLEETGMIGFFRLIIVISQNTPCHYLLLGRI